MATKLRDDQFAAVRVDLRGTERDLLVWSRPVLWYTTSPDHLVLLVIVRDPKGVMHDDFFFTTDLAASPAHVASLYAGRWSIECVNREVKQCLGAQDPRAGRAKGPSALPRCRYGSTRQSGPGTSRTAPRLSPRSCGRGTRRRRHRASSTRSPRRDASFGPNEFQGRRPMGSSTRNLSAACSTHSLERRELDPRRRCSAAGTGKTQTSGNGVSEGRHGAQKARDSEETCNDRRA